MTPKAMPTADLQDKSKHVCMIAYTNYVFDGRVRQEAEALVEWGHSVLFLVPKEGEKPKDYVLGGVEVRELNVRKHQGNGTIRYLLSYTWFLILAFFACSRLFLSSRIKVFHVHNMPNVLVLAGLLPRMFGGRLIFDIHDTVPETYAAKFGNSSSIITGILRLEERFSCSLAHRLIAVNHVQREAIIQRGIPAEKIATVLTIPRYAIPKLDGNGRPQSQGFRMVNHGTIAPRLGNDLIVEAAAKLVHLIPGFELHFIGGGEGLNQLARLSESLGIEKFVHFHKSVPWNMLPKMLENMDAGIVANRRNVATELMLPAKLMDYAALGIPALVPRLRGIQYYFSDEMVTFFEPGDVDSMVEATLRLYRDQVRRTQQPLMARKFIEKYTWDNAQMSLKSVYENLWAETVPSARMAPNGVKRSA